MSSQIEPYSIYQVDELIFDIYSAVYAKIAYKTKLIDVSNLKMIRFKLTDYDLDTIFNKTKILYADQYPTGLIMDGVNINQLWFKRKGEIHLSTIRIIPYFSKESLDDMTDPINVNQVLKTLLSELVTNDKTNGILLPIVNVDVMGSDLVPYEKVKPYIDAKKYYSIELTEKFYSLTTLDNFFRSYPLDMRVLKSIIYQAVDILYQINIAYPKFRYNQMFPETINCYLKRTENNVKFPELKLSDFYLAEIEEIVPNNYIRSGIINIPNIESGYSDLYQLLNYMWNNLNIDIKKYPELISLFDIILPKKIRSNDKYLTIKLWNTLTDDEKNDLGIKNIRNGTFFTSQDSLLNTTFVETDDLLSRINTNPSNSESINGIAGAMKNIQMHGDASDSEDDFIASNEELDEESNEELNEESNEEYSDSDSIFEGKSNGLNNPDSVDKDELENNEQNSLQSFNKGIALSNKKYSNNDIDSMSNKKSKSNRKNNYHNEKQYTDEINEEHTEERDTYSRPSRIIGVTNANIGSKKKLKSYHGTRYINTTDPMSLLRELNDRQPNSNNNKNPYDNGMNQFNNIQNPYDSGMNQFNNTQSRINSIGNALGATPGEMNNMNPNVNYNQLTQKLAQRYNMDQNNLSTQGQFPPNIPSQIPTNILNPIGQNSPQQPDDNFLSRYMAASNQMPMQNVQNTQSQPQMQSQGQIDPNMLAYYMQQQQQQNNQQAPYMQNQPTYAPTQQMTGGNNKPFFFQ